MDRDKFAKLQWKSCFGGLGCLEVACDGDQTYIRDSANPDVVIETPFASWDAFRAAVKRGAFDE
ncbi:DUF397 domain-containing protein [Candidatus Kaiserbacteria bacterium]|nr:DUF397 domain-containing protein [Candidatus Kaiserbacteria bacterium]